VEATPRVQAQHSIRGVLPLSPASVAILHAMAPRLYTQTLRSPVQVRSVGDALGAPVLDLWTVLQQEPGWEALLEDGLHFTTGGQRAVRAALLRCIAERLPHLRCARLSPCFYPYFMYDLLHSSQPHSPVPAGLARLTRCIVWFSAQRPVHAAALDASIALLHRPALTFLCAGPKRVAGGCVGARRPEALPDDFPQHRDVDGACPANSFTA